MSGDPFEPRLPVREGRERDLYFYLEPIEAYHPDARVTVQGSGDMIMLGSYSYLDLNGHPKITQAAHAAIDRYGTGTHGVRLLSGTLDLHRELEARVAAFARTEAAATFSSGYLANVSTIACLVGRGDTVLCDKRDHASIVDGCRLSRARFIRFRHKDMAHLESCLTASAHRGRTLVVTDAVFSMDGDIAALPELAHLCRKHGALLMVDESHSIGVLGATGHGVEEHFGLPADSIDVKMGTFSKAIPSVGGYVAASAKVCTFLAHEARGFIYSGALPPAAAAAALASLDVIEAEPERVQRLHANCAYFAKGLAEAGIPVRQGGSAIFPIIVGDDWKAWTLARYCQKRGIYVQAIPHPIVPHGTARLRASVTAGHAPAVLDQCIAVLSDGVRDVLA